VLVPLTLVAAVVLATDLADAHDWSLTPLLVGLVLALVTLARWGGARTPRTARSTTVALTSWACATPSTTVPTTPGRTSRGGANAGATTPDHSPPRTRWRGAWAGSSGTSPGVTASNTSSRPRHHLTRTPRPARASGTSPRAVAPTKVWRSTRAGAAAYAPACPTIGPTPGQVMLITSSPVVSRGPRGARGHRRAEA
jgi:hypothetical protein